MDMSGYGSDGEGRGGGSFLGYLVFLAIIMGACGHCIEKSREYEQRRRDIMHEKIRWVSEKRLNRSSITAQVFTEKGLETKIIDHAYMPILRKTDEKGVYRRGDSALMYVFVKKVNYCSDDGEIKRELSFKEYIEQGRPERLVIKTE